MKTAAHRQHVFRCYPLPSNMDIGSEDIDRQLNKVKIFPGMPNLRKNPFSMDCYHLFQSTDKQMIYGRIYGFFSEPSEASYKVL